MERRDIGIATLYHGDCLDLMDALLAADAVVADPPYGIDLNSMSGTYRSRYVKAADEYLVEGDDKPFDPEPWLAFPKTILWGANHFASRLPDARKWIIWDKREGTTPDNQADCEMAYTNLKGPARLYSQLWRGMCRRGEENISRQGRVHPTQKPVALMMYCIEQCQLPPESLIVDPYMGSGTTGVAAVRLGHRFIGVEKVRRHFETACTRIEVEQQQCRLAL